MDRTKRSRALVVSVTGHRSLGPATRRVARCVASECVRLREAYPTRKFVVISPLAEGADRVVARIAVDLLDARLVVPLPLPLDDPHGYLRDFPQSTKEFRQMLRKADETFLAPLRSRDSKWRDDSEAREKQYAWVGAYVAEHADILFAIWDGKPARGLGGTAHVVKWFLAGHVPRAHSTLASSRQAGPLPGGRPMLLIHINPQTGQVERVPVGRARPRRGGTQKT
jgi:hypothetical protein